MPERENRRNFRRVTGQFLVTYQVSGQDSRPAKCRDLSAGGMKLEVGEDIPVGTRLNIELAVSNPQQGRVYHCEGRVVWNQTEPLPRLVFVTGVSFNELFMDLSEFM